MLNAGRMMTRRYSGLILFLKARDVEIEQVERRRRRRRRGNDAEDGGDLDGKSHRRSLVLRGGDGEQTSNVSRWLGNL